MIGRQRWTAATLEEAMVKARRVVQELNSPSIPYYPRSVFIAEPVLVSVGPDLWYEVHIRTQVTGYRWVLLDDGQLASERRQVC